MPLPTAHALALCAPQQSSVCKWLSPRVSAPRAREEFRPGAGDAIPADRDNEQHGLAAGEGCSGTDQSASACLRHTFGQRLRDAGVNEENRALLLGHAIEGMPQHYASATVARLVDAANRVRHTVDRTTLLRVVNG